MLTDAAAGNDSNDESFQGSMAYKPRCVADALPAVLSASIAQTKRPATCAVVAAADAGATRLIKFRRHSAPGGMPTDAAAGNDSNDESFQGSMAYKPRCVADALPAVLSASIAQTKRPATCAVVAAADAGATRLIKFRRHSAPGGMPTDEAAGNDADDESFRGRMSYQPRYVADDLPAVLSARIVQTKMPVTCAMVVGRLPTDEAAGNDPDDEYPDDESL